MDNKIKLFQTAKKICERGDIKLSTADKRRIENETRDLLRKSMTYRSASGTSIGFRKVLSKLGTTKNSVEIFKVVAQYLEDEGVLDKDVKIEDILEAVEEAVEEVLVEDKPEKEDKEESDFEGGGIPKSKDDKKDDKDDKKDDKDDDDDDDDDKDDDKDESNGKIPPQFLDNVNEAKEAVLKLSQELDMVMDGEPSMVPSPLKDKGKEKGKDKGKGLKKKFPKLDEIDKKDKDEEMITEDEMGIDKGPSSNIFAKIKVSITSDKNIVASHEDHGPLFLAVPTDDVKRDPEKLRRSANKVYGLVVYDGPKVAAEKCGTTLIANIDDDITLDSDAEVSPNEDSVTDDGEGDTVEEREAEPNTVLDDADTETEDKPDKVTAIRRRLSAKRRAKRRAQDTILDDAEDLTEESPDVSPTSLSSLDDDETDTQESRPSEPTDLLSDGETDTQLVEANFKKLYATRTNKKVAEEIEKFITKFTRCMRIASRRMDLNHDLNPMKAVAMDVLTANDISFSDGEFFVPMDDKTAKEIVELISADSHDEFVGHLMDKAADLMNKSSEYLQDIESDIDNLVPVDVEIDNVQNFNRSARDNSRSEELRIAASRGNFNVNTSGINTHNDRAKPISQLKAAIGSTKIGMRTARLSSLAGKR